MSYTNFKTSGRSTYAQVDITRFATDLCSAMGGTDLNINTRDTRAEFMLGKDRLRISTSHYNAKPEVSFSIDTPDVSAEDLKWNGGRQTERASVNPDARSIEKIAADIKRRVVDGSAEVTAWRRAQAAEYAKIRDRLAEIAPSMTSLGLSVHPEDNGLALRALTNEPTLISAKITTTTVEIARLQNLSLDQFRRIMAIVNEKTA